MSNTEEKEQEYKGLIMVVDDNAEFLSGVELTLQMEGYQVIIAVNGQHALDKLQTAFLGKGEEGVSMERLPDLILADIMMPVMDGYALYDRVRASPYTNHIPFIFLTAKSAQEDIRHGKELGADDYLAKPFSTEDLLASIRGKLRRDRQRRTLTSYLSQDFNGPRSGMVILVAVVSLLVLGAFCLGLALPQLLR